MAQNKIRQRSRAELVAALAESRSAIHRDASDLTDLANVSKRVRSTLADSPLGKTAAALVAGLVSSKLLSKKKHRGGAPKSGWLRSLFPEFDLKLILTSLLRSYLEPGQVDIAALVRDRLREYLK